MRVNFNKLVSPQKLQYTPMAQNMRKNRYLSYVLIIGSLLTIIGCSNNANNTPNEPVKTVNQTEKKSDENPHGGHGDGKAKININTAILSELDKLEAKLGVPALSNKIQSSRPYTKPEDLVSKNVINQQQYDQIKDLITIEDIVLTGEAKDIDYMVKLGLMKGHLLVAKELLDLKKPKDAEPHIGHPVEEIYADIEEQLKERNVPDFKNILIALQDLVKSKPDDAKIGTKFVEVTTAIDKAIASIPENQRTNPQFILKVINGLLDTANSEYKAAVANGKITAAIEYQDSRGFVIYAESLYKTIEPKMTKDNPDIHKFVSKNLVDLKTNWPQVIPPATPVKTPDQISQLIKEIEENTSKVLGK